MRLLAFVDCLRGRSVVPVVKINRPSRKKRSSEQGDAKRCKKKRRKKKKHGGGCNRFTRTSPDGAEDGLLCGGASSRACEYS